MRFISPFLQGFRPRLLLGLLLSVPGLAGIARAQPAAPPDTLTGQAHALANVQVVGSRPSRYAVGSRALALDSAALSQYRTGTLAEALAARTPIYFKNYGPGQLASVSIRGTSARHTAVLWNGININFSSLGEADFSLLPIAGATRVEVQPGPAGSLYGTGAVGGTVLLSGQPGWGRGLQASMQADAGSFGLGAGSAEASYGTSRLALRTTGLYRTAQNDFPLSLAPTAPRQQNAAFSQWNFTQDARLRVGEKGQLALAAWLTGADRQIQPPLGGANRHGRETDRSSRLLAEYRRHQGRYEGALRVAYVEDHILYGDDTLEPVESNLQTTQVQTEHTFTFSPKASLRLGGEAQHFAGTVDGYDLPIRENRYAGFGLLRYDPLPALRLSLNLRQALVPAQHPPLAPTAGAEWDFWHLADRHTFTLKASAARSYRAATFNERYWPTGNPQILPETGLGFEAGLLHATYAAAPLHWRSELTAYRQVVDNWVQWVTTSIGSSPRNLRQVLTQGIEANTTAEWRRPGYQAALRASYAYTEARKQRGYAGDADPTGNQLPFVPLHAASLSTEQTWRGRWLLNAGGSFSSYRYVTAGADEFLPAYFLLQGSLGRYFLLGPARLTLLVQGYNLTNAIYQTYNDRAMPPRSGVLSLRVSWR
jgi:vitamin B12 transporter